MKKKRKSGEVCKEEKRENIKKKNKSRRSTSAFPFTFLLVVSLLLITMLSVPFS